MADVLTDGADKTLEDAGDAMAFVLGESEYAENQLLAREWWAMRGRCPVCIGELPENHSSAECDPSGCPSRDGSDAVTTDPNEQPPERHG